MYVYHQLLFNDMYVVFKNFTETENIFVIKNISPTMN